MQVVAPLLEKAIQFRLTFFRNHSRREAQRRRREILIRRERMPSLSFSLFPSRRRSRRSLSSFFPSRWDKHGARRGVAWRPLSTNRTAPWSRKTHSPRAAATYYDRVRAGAVTPRETLSALWRPECSRCLSRHARPRAAILTSKPMAGSSAGSTPHHDKFRVPRITRHAHTHTSKHPEGAECSPTGGSPRYSAES